MAPVVKLQQFPLDQNCSMANYNTHEKQMSGFLYTTSILLLYALIMLYFMLKQICKQTDEWMLTDHGVLLNRNRQASQRYRKGGRDRRATLDSYAFTQLYEHITKVVAISGALGEQPPNTITASARNMLTTTAPAAPTMAAPVGSQWTNPNEHQTQQQKPSHLESAEPVDPSTPFVSSTSVQSTDGPSFPMTTTTQLHRVLSTDSDYKPADECLNKIAINQFVGQTAGLTDDVNSVQPEAIALNRSMRANFIRQDALLPQGSI